MKAPPSFGVQGGRAVFIDIQKAHYSLRYDFSKQKVFSNSTLTFYQGEEGLPILNFAGHGLSVAVDGSPTTTRLITQPAPFSLIEIKLGRGIHIVNIDSERTFESSNDDGAKDWIPAILDYFAFEDGASPRGKYLDYYLPSNLAFDQYPMTFEIDASDSSRELYLLANGETKSLAKNTWQVKTPASYNCSSVLFVVADSEKSKISMFEYISVDGRKIPITNLTGVKTDPAGHNRELASIVKKLEKYLAPWPYNHIIHFGQIGGVNGMEYAGGFEGGSTFHELLHSYFARGVYPVDGNAEWFDEHVATAVYSDNIGLPANRWGEPMGLEPKVPVTGYSPYLQGIPPGINSHNPRPIQSWNNEFQSIGGIMPFLRFLVSKYMYKTISTEEIKRELEAFTGRDLTNDFNHWIYVK